jgi:6-phosphogluconolactonase
MTPRIIVTPPGEFASAAGRHIAEIAQATLRARHACTLALCGGNTPEPIYRNLAQRDIQWDSVSVYFGDERAVPPHHPDSNYRMARLALIDHVALAPDRVHRMMAERADRAQAASDYAALLPDQLDILLLGVGPDGHTASLFPRAPALAETVRRVVDTGRPALPVQPQVERLTITPLVIAAAREVIVMVSGATKAPLLVRILEGPEAPNELPAQLARRGTWILDPAAASLLQPQGS